MIDYSHTKDIIKAIRNVGMYVRLSRAEEGEEDLVKHKTSMIEICDKYNWNYVMYSEIGSGETIEKRAKMRELLDDVSDELFDAVIVYDYDRLGRGRGSDQERIIDTFKDSDTLVVTVNPFEILDLNNERDEETVEFKGFLARREYKMIRKRMEAGMRISLKMGKWVSGNAPFGYKINSQLKKLVIDKEESSALRDLIFDPYLNGYSSVEVADELNLRGIQTSGGKKWTPKMVLYVLKNKTYLGHTYYNRRYQDNKKKGTLKPESEWAVSENTHPPLLTEEEHNQILHLIGQKSSSGEKGINPLGSLIKCYHCGANMSIKTANGEKAIRNCINCEQNRGGYISIIEDAIKDAITIHRERLLSGDHDFEKDRILQAAKDDIVRIESEILKKEKAIEKIQEAFEEGMYSIDQAKERIRTRQQELLILTKTLKEQKKSFKSLNIIDSKSHIKRLEHFLNEIDVTTNPKTLKTMYKDIFHDIIWQRDKWDEIKITINFK